MKEKLINFIYSQPLVHFGEHLKKRQEKMAKLHEESGPFWDPAQG